MATQAASVESMVLALEKDISSALVTALSIESVDTYKQRSTRSPNPNKYTKIERPWFDAVCQTAKIHL